MLAGIAEMGMLNPFAARLALVVLAIPGLAVAQTAARGVPADRPDQNPAGPASPGARPPAPARGAAPRPMAAFTIQSIEIAGSSLEAGALRLAYGRFIGQGGSPAVLQQLADAISAAYERSDVALYTVLIPDQDFAQGRVKLSVLEGEVGEVTVDRAHAGRAGALVQAMAIPLTGQAPLSKPDLQRRISLIRDLPGVATDMQLLHGAQDRQVDLALTPTLKRVQLGLGVNTRGSAFLGRTQVQGDLYLNSLVKGGDQTRLTLAAPTSDDLFRFASLGHSTPVGVNGARLSLSASYLRTRPATTALLGHSTSLGMQFSYPLQRAYQHDLYLTLGADGLNSDNALFSRTFSDDRSRALRAALAYDRTGDRSSLAISGTFSQGFKGLGSRTASAALTDLGFTKLNARLSYGRQLTTSLVWRTNAIAQLTSDPLPGSEQLSIGGDDYGRAYESSIVAGDTGYGLSTELAVRPQRLPAALKGSEAYGFADGGRVLYRARAVFAEQDYHLASVGGGVRLNLKGRALLDLQAAKGFANSTPFLDDRGWRGVMSLRTLF